MTGFILTMLPVLLLAVLGLHVVWEVVSVRQALRVGTYQAARYLSSEPVQSGSAAEWNREAQRMILSELRQNTVLKAYERGQLTDADLRGVSFSAEVEEPVPSEWLCRGSGSGRVPFIVEGRLRFEVNLLAGLPVSGGVRVPFNLIERQTGEVICAAR